MVIAAALVEDEDKTEGVTIRDAVQMSEIATIENHLSKEKPNTSRARCALMSGFRLIIQLIFDRVSTG